MTGQRGATAVDLQSHQEAVLHWSAEHEAALAELAEFEATRVGGEVLTARGSLDKVADKLRKLRDRVELSERAVAEATVRRDEALVASWLAAADEWDAEAERRSAAAAAHAERAAQLLEQLQAHDGARYVAQGPTRSGMLRVEVEQAWLSAHVARAVAAGEDPMPLLNGLASVVNGTVHGLPPASYFPAGHPAAEAAQDSPVGDLVEASGGAA